MEKEFFNLNWENSMDQPNNNNNNNNNNTGAAFESALSSFVSSPSSASNTRGGGGGGSDSVVIRELIGRLGSICNSNDISASQSHTFNYMGGDSPNTSSYTTPLNSPPKLNNLSMPSTTHLAPFPADPAFAERAARFSCFGNNNLGGLMSQFGFNDITTTNAPPGNLSRVSSSQSLKAAALQDTEMRSISKFNHLSSRSSSPEEPNSKGDGRKRKAATTRGKAKENKETMSSSSKEIADDDKSNGKRCKSNENEKVAKVEPNGGGDGNKKQSKDTPKPSPEPPKDYIHVRARRGQATDSHSLAERVRREKISERMKFLQDLVPGCNKVTGKALMLDEIINYVQSLQRQVEFLSMKLATVNPRLDFNMEASLTKDLLQSRESLSQAMYQLNSSAAAFHYSQQGEGPPLHRDMPTNRNDTNRNEMNPLDTTTLHRNTSMELPPLDGFGEAAAHFANFWEDDLQSVVQMGFGQNQSQETGFESQSFHATNMKVEL